MSLIDPAQSVLLVIDVQARLMPAIPNAAALVREARRLLDAAALLGIPVIVTEQNPAGLGATAPALLPPGAVPFVKQHFNACREPAFADRLQRRREVVVVGCETHVCVLQTVLGLLREPFEVHVVQDAVGSRTEANRVAALNRMASHGADLVTAEMVVFEWLETAEHPRFRDGVRLVK